MPTYEYACKSCGDHVEVVQSFKDEPLTECPKCGGPLRKVFGSIGIAFKGSGFYKTDSRSTSAAGKPAAGGSKSDGAAAGGGSDGGSGSGSGSGSEGSGGSAPAKREPAASKSDSSSSSPAPPSSAAAS
jgi:putative FmdB family regulatory protein